MDLSSTTRCYGVNQVPSYSLNTRTSHAERFLQLPYDTGRLDLTFGGLRSRLTRTLDSIAKKNPVNYVSSKESPLSEDSQDPLSQPLASDVLKALLVDKERANLLRKLSEANQQNRFLKRQLQAKEESLDDFKRELAKSELEIQALIKLEEEIASATIVKGTRKINGKYIQSHLVSRLEALLEKLRELIKDVGGAQSREVPLYWYGVAESVQVMGTFDGWSQGEYLSQEYTGSYTRFSTTLLLRPGRYEIKFLVDGEWQLSPKFPTVGEGLKENNLLVVE